MMSHKTLLGLFCGAGLALSCLGGPAACRPGEADARPVVADGGEALAAWSGKPKKAWTEYDRLVEEQKFEEAARWLEARLDRVRKDPEEATRCLVRLTQARMALHGYETAVRFLRETAWPDDALARAVLDLYYAHALRTYSEMYDWEVRKRERVVSREVVDLKAWTFDQVHEEARAAFARVFALRGSLGDVPVQALTEFLEPNDYPPGVRPTLRDAVTYLFAELLANSGSWSAAQSAETWRLDLGAMLANGQAIAGDLDLTRHPVEVLAAVLGDLEAWHQARGEAEAAFEARLQRLRHLHDALTEPADRARIREDLERRLPAMEGRPWWAMGMADLATFVETDDTPDALARAHRIARTCHAASPDTPGGKRCLAIQKAIEAPEFSLQAMAADAPGKRSVGVRYKNLRFLHFRAYALDLFRHLERSKDYSLLPDHDDVKHLMRGATPVHEWTLDLDETKDFRPHQAWTTPPMTRPGLYVVVASARPGFARSDNVMQAIPIVVGDLVLVTRQEADRAEVRVRSGSTGRPVEGARVVLYGYNWNTGHRPVQERISGRDGEVLFDRQADDRYHFVVAVKGGEVAIDPQYLYFYRTSKPHPVRGALIYTDRSVYRPLQALKFKVVAFRGNPERTHYATEPDRDVRVSLVDANGQVVESKTLKTNRYGTASGEFSIPAGRLLGQWAVRTDPSGHAAIRVEEYKRPTFEVRVLEPPEPLRLNRPAVLRGEARYYFGLPVTSGQVRFRVSREPVFPWWWEWWGWWAPRPTAQRQTVASGTAALDEAGRFEVRFTPEADERLAADQKDLSYRYLVEADVTDEGGETRTASRAFRLGFGAVEARLVQDVGFLEEGRRGKVQVLRTDLDGTPAPGKGSWRVVALKGPDRALLPADQPLPEPPQGTFWTEGDRLRPRWDSRYDASAVMRGWKDGAEAARGDVEHGKDGVAPVTLPALAAGAYRLRYQTVDAFGTPYEMSHEFIVAGPRMNVPLPALVLVERPVVKVGETARVLVHSGLADQPIAVEMVQDGRRVASVPQPSALIEIPITEAHRGGFVLSVEMVRDHQFLSYAPAIQVPWDDKELTVSFETFRDLLRPGAREKWTVKVTGPAGRDAAVAAAEVLAYMYDRSLDLFAPHAPPSLRGLYASRHHGPVPRASLGAAQVTWVECDGFTPGPGWSGFTRDSLRFYESYGIGGPGSRRAGYLMMAPSAAAPRARGAPEETTVMSAEGVQAVPPDRAASAGDRLAEDEDKAGEKAEGPAPVAPETPLRADFSETAFFAPHLVTGPDGTAAVEFTVPDSVTGWNVWVHAVTNDLKAGSLKQEARSVKDLMVRPYLPRFLREGDAVEVRVAVNNASDRDLAGTVDLDILDPESGRSVLADFGVRIEDATGRPFAVKPDQGATVTFRMRAPSRVGMVAFRVVARSGDFSDGELRPVPILPGRVHLAQSRFVTLKGAERRVVRFEDLARAGNDPTLIHEQLVVTVDAQLFYSVLSSLPYLVNYPYECTEQTLNRFLSTGIMTSFYDQYPALATMAREFSKRETRYESWDQADPNRKMMLEETPWVVEARGGAEAPGDLINVLDPRITKAQRDAALAKLRKAQTSLGAFPWFPGGPPSPYMTLYLLYGFSKGLEFGVEVPKDMVVQAWRYMHRHYVDEVVREMMAHDCCWEFITFLHFVLSSYPDDSWTGGVFTAAERKTMLDFSFRHWKQHAPYVKGQLALTLKRMGRAGDARLVWASVMDSAKSERDQGTFWAPEDRAWLWYNDTIETHAFALRTLMELDPENDKLDGLVLWLFLNKKLNHWKSTRATAEVIYSLAHYLKKTEQIGVREEAVVHIGGDERRFVFEPDRYTGKKNQIVVPGTEVRPESHAEVVVEKATKGYLFASATWHFSTERMPEEARGDFMSVTRTYYLRDKSGREVVLKPLAEGTPVTVGDEVEVHLSIRTKHAMEYVHLRDPRAAGFEPVSLRSGFRWDLGLGFYEEVRDSGQNFFFEALPQGEYAFKYRIRAAQAGTFKAGPATIQPMYAPEFTAYSAGHVLTVRGE